MSKRKPFNVHPWNGLQSVRLIHFKVLRTPPTHTPFVHQVAIIAWSSILACLHSIPELTQNGCLTCNVESGEWGEQEGLDSHVFVVHYDLKLPFLWGIYQKIISCKIMWDAEPREEQDN